jgi:hypothetical protein
MKQFKHIFPLILAVVALVKPADSADFYIFSSIVKVTLLDSYEQPMSESDKEALGSGFPLEIINSKITLGDQITDAFKCKNNDRYYYLIRDEGGSFTGSTRASFQKQTATTSQWDTVELTSNATLSGTSPLSLSKGTTVIRIFQKSGSTYIFAPDRNVYGFVQSTSIFRKRTSAVSQPVKVNTTDIVESIRRRLDAANEHYTSTFNFFNTHTGQQKSVPAWFIESNGNTIICTLKGSKQTITQMEQSTSHIVKDIEHFLLSKPYSVRYENFQITISTKDHP